MTQKHHPDASLLDLLQEVHRRLSTEPLTAEHQRSLMQMVATLLETEGKRTMLPLVGDMQDIRGQNHVKRALEVAAAGGHHVLLVGPPGAGKSSLARTLPSILPTTAIPTPFRAPDPAITKAAFIGKPSVPGELTLAHGGMLFIKDLHEFASPLLAALRRAVETHTVAMGEEQIFPASFLLVATLLPCSCGFYGDPVTECSCDANAILAHQRRLKRVIDACFAILVEVPRVREDLLSRFREESSAQVCRRVEAARERQQRRYAAMAHLGVNADLSSVDEIQRFCPLDESAQILLKTALRQLRLAPRAILRVQQVARTIADLAQSEVIAANHLAEAIAYRARI